jgi:hypothetical protein
LNDLLTRISELEKELVELKGQSKNPTFDKISHMVFVRNTSGDYWPRMEVEFKRAQGHYSNIIEQDPFTDVSEPLPQIIAYSKGIPVYRATGIREVSEALSRISRGEFVSQP